MSTFQVIAGLGGGVALGAVAYFTWRVLQHLQDHKDIALAMFFVDHRSAQTFELLSLALLLLSVSMGVQVVARLYRVTYLIEFTHLTNLAILLVFALVYWRFADIAEKPSRKYRG